MKYIFFILDIIICTCSYAGIYYFKNGSFIPQGEYLTLFIVYAFFWVFFSVYYNKYKCAFTATFRAYYRSLFISSSLALLLLVLIVALTDLKIVSRLFLISIIAVPSLLELLVISLRKRWLSVNRRLEMDIAETGKDAEKMTLKLKWLVSGLVLLIIAFITMVNNKTGSFVYYPWSEKILLILLVSWLLSIGMTGKYKYYQSHNLYYQIAPFIKSGFIMVIIAGFVYYFLRLESLSRRVLFGTIPLYIILETIVFSFLFLSNKQKPVTNKKENLSSNKNGNIFGQEPLSISPPLDKPPISANIQSLFKRVSIKDSDEIMQFIMKYIDCNFEKDSLTLLDTTSIENINILENQSQNLLINIHKINDIRRLNEYLISCQTKIKSGGVLFGCLVPLERERHRLRHKMPKFLFNIIYPFHFLFYRVLPKIPKIRHLYFVLTNGKNRVVSKSEMLGRLSFCGYKIIGEKMLGNTFYFIAKKLNTISTEDNPSYSPIVRLKRVGFEGERINIYKFRTMHPYSEFIQKEIYERNHLDSFGKIDNDFRITNWGKIMRKLWIDELPQLYNWLRGDLTLVGTRALSEHYLSLYPTDLQKLRLQFKPGLVPPYYVDMPKNFDEIIESERKYLEKKKRKAFSTDIIYFYTAFINIVFHGARSK